MNEKPLRPDRNIEEARLDASYNVRLQELHSRFYRRLRYGVSVISLLAGSSAIASVSTGHSTIAGVAGVIVAFVTFLDTAIDFAGKGALHEAQRRRYLDLLKSGPASLAEFDKKMWKIEMDDPGVIESLRVPAFNDNLRSNGYESEVRPENFQQRLARFAV